MLNFLTSSRNCLTALLLFLGLEATAVVNAPVISHQQHPEVALLLLASRPLKSHELLVNDLSAFGICSGAFISDHQVLTAGHCIKNEGPDSWVYLARREGAHYRLVAPVKVITPYIYENLEGVENSQQSACSAGPKPLPQTKTLDIAQISFPEGSSERWFTLNLSYHPRLHDRVQFFGFGTEFSPFDGSPGPFASKNPQLRTGHSRIWRVSSQRIGFVAVNQEAFAADGDSGGPVIINNQLVALLSTVSERCETELGEDYGILNTATLLKAAK